MSVTKDYETVSEQLHTVLKENSMSENEHTSLGQYISYMLGITDSTELDQALLNHIQFYSEQGIYIEPSPMSLEALKQAQ